MFHEAKLETRIDLILKRYGIVAASSAGIGALTDITSPIGGFYVSAGVLVVCILLMLLIWLKRAWIIKLVEKRGFLQDTLGDFLPGEIACHKTPLFQYAFIAAIVFGYTCYATKANADDGGMLASRFDHVSAFQSMMGIMKSVQEDVGQIRRDTTEIKEAMKGLDKETSDNPRKELAKRGMNWHPFDFFNAAASGDLENTRLFRLAGMKYLGDATAPCQMFTMQLLFEYHGTPESETAIWEEVLAAIGDGALNEECADGYDTLNDRQLQARPEIRATLVKNWQYYKDISDAYTLHDFSLLMLAVWINDVDMVKLFLAHGAKVDRGMGAIDFGHGRMNVAVTPLSEANRLGLKEIANVLKEYGGKDARTDIGKLVKKPNF